MVGKPVRVQFGERGESFVGRLTEFNEDDGKHKVEYTDGDVKWYDMDEKKWSEVGELEYKSQLRWLREMKTHLSPLLPHAIILLLMPLMSSHPIDFLI